MHPDGTTSVYCRQCGREIIRQTRPVIRTVTKCQICILKEQGVENPEDYVLPQYYLSTDPNKLPIPIDADMSLEGGILVLNPPGSESTGMEKIPQSGGLFGTVRSLFKVLGFKPQEKEKPVSQKVAKEKRTGGLYDDRIR